MRPGVVSDVLGSNDRLAKRRQAFDEDGFDDHEDGVVILMLEDVAHSRDLIRYDIGRGAEDISVDVLDRLADLHQSRSARLIVDAVV
ncbi:MAG: hypothetical protein HIU84_09145 [Acidobacteria bacterium]|nr:hypothetical protein [Acidobacteriota bacterium]